MIGAKTPPIAAAPTIVAISSGAGRAGVTVVRLSGSRVRFALETISGPLPPARRASLRTLRDPADGEPIDRGLVLFFPSPHSFTGEDSAELQVHGSRAVLRRLLTVLASLDGVRLAQPGEFTRRAFENGKLDLAAVEGLADLIDSETEWQRRQALRQMEGELGVAVAGWRDRLISAMALLEAELDFADEGDVEAGVAAGARDIASSLRREFGIALAGFSRGERIRDGFAVVLIGAPNAGKSSLLNALIRRDAAIVSNVPGTTRDVLEVRLDLDGMPVLLMDTAGLRDSQDQVEREGVKRALARAGEADLVVRLVPVNETPDTVDPAELLVRSKADLSPCPGPGLAVSTVSGTGLDQLRAEIATRLRDLGSGEPALVTRERHRDALGEAAAALHRAEQVPAGRPELMAEEFRLAVRRLDALVGRVDVETVLDRLFAGFCIGK